MQQRSPTQQLSPRISGKDLVEIRTKMPMGIYNAYREMYRAVRQDSTIEKPLRELLRLKSAQLARCVH